jgi:PAS domain S-box-containing protein
MHPSSSYLMQLAVDRASDSVFQVAPDGRIVYANAAACAALGYAREELLGLSVSDIDPDCPPAHWAQVWKALRERGTVTLDSRHRTRDGQMFHVEISATFVGGGGAEFSFAIARDITRRRQEQQDLREAEERFRQLAGHIDEVLWITDAAKTQVIYVSPGYEKLWGRPSAALYAAPASWLDAVHPADRERVRLAALTRQALGAYDETYRILRPDGSERWIHERAFPVRGAGGEIYRILGVAKDVTGQRAAAQRLSRMNEELERAVARRTAELQEANRDLESFSYSISHDLRAPLRAIDAFSAMVAEDCAHCLDADSARRLAAVRQSAQKMGQMISDMLAFARTARGDVVGVPVDMGQIVREAFESLGPVAGPPVTLTAAALPWTWGDPAMLRQVLANLLGNAVKFSGGCSDPVIEVTGCLQGHEVVYAVKDNGVGFDSRNAEDLFGVFQRLHDPAAFEGTGIGLAIVKRIVEKHGGRVWAESSLGRGATFFFALPCRGTADAKAAS